MESHSIRIVQIKGVLIIGQILSAPTIEIGWFSPRVLQLLTDQNGNTAIRISVILGSPSEISIKEYDLIYTVEDENLIRMYREQISGLILPKIQTPSNVVNIGGKGNA